MATISWSHALSRCTTMPTTSYCPKLRISTCWTSYTELLQSLMVPAHPLSYLSFLALPFHKKWPTVLTRELCLNKGTPLPYRTILAVLHSSEVKRKQDDAIITRNKCRIQNNKTLFHSLFEEPMIYLPCWYPLLVLCSQLAQHLCGSHWSSEIEEALG